MLTDQENSFYRPCVGITIFNPEGKVFIGKRRFFSKSIKNKDYIWQMPQGGIDQGESLKQALYRELFEETGCQILPIIASIDGWLYYDFPDFVKSDNFFYAKGQKQKWFLLFLDKDHLVNIEALGEEREFVDWKWCSLEEAVELVIPFKKHIYERVKQDFSPIIYSFCSGLKKK
jgi:putative (di)nucleoside polyphosphate hydrolase